MKNVNQIYFMSSDPWLKHSFILLLPWSSLYFGIVSFLPYVAPNRKKVIYNFLKLITKMVKLNKMVNFLTLKVQRFQEMKSEQKLNQRKK